MKTISLRKKDKWIVVRCLDKSRVEHHGFGTFYWKLKPEEVDIDNETFEFISKSINREYSSLGDLFGLEIKNAPDAVDKRHRGYHIVYGTRKDTLYVPIEDVTIDYEIYKQLIPNN